MEPWYKIATPRKEVREGRSFNPDEFAIALEQVVAGTAPDDYRDPAQFFARTCFTRALREHSGMVLRRLSGRTDNTSPVLTLITQFGGGKTHTLTTLYHLAKNGEAVAGYDGVAALVREAGVSSVPKARVAVFVGNAWDPQPGRETPWIDIARQLAGDKGVEADLGDGRLICGPQLLTAMDGLHAGRPSVRHDDSGCDRVGVGERHVPGADAERFGAAGRNPGDLEPWRCRVAAKDLHIGEPHAAEASAEQVNPISE